MKSSVAHTINYVRLKQPPPCFAVVITDVIFRHVFLEIQGHYDRLTLPLHKALLWIVKTEFSWTERSTQSNKLGWNALCKQIKQLININKLKNLP